MNETQLIFGIDELGVFRQQLAGNRSELSFGHPDLHSRVLERTEESVEMVFQPKWLVTERARHLGHGRAENDPGVKDRQMCLRRGKQLAVQKDEWLGHGSRE